MKTEISRDSHQPKKRYTGVYQQQGRMLTDADWNELVDIVKSRLSDALTDVVGNGSPIHKNVVNNQVTPPVLEWGFVFVDGIQVEIRAAESATLQPEFEYQHQLDFPSAPALPEAPDDHYLFYVDVWERTVTHLMDERLRDKGMHGADTCSRKQLMAQVKWCPIGIDPETASENPQIGNAELSLTLLKKTTNPDPCDPCADLVDVESRIGNYLFRLEIHNVKGAADDPTEITLKWSSENAAELYINRIPPLGPEPELYIPAPPDFTNAQSIYEFFDEQSDQLLGVQLATGFAPVRGELIHGYPAAPPAKMYVRRWDGYCVLTKTGGVWEVTEQFDQNQSGSGGASFCEIVGTQLSIELDAQDLELTLNKSFVTGDFWIAEVREIEDDSGSVIIDSGVPNGILHHYLTLGEIQGPDLQPNPEADRKYAFPSLTEMTSMTMAGGNAQLVLPGHDLDHPLAVDITNGEWPVSGALLRFQIESVDGELSKPAAVNAAHFNLVSAKEAIVTSDKGISACSWKVGANNPQRVKVSLIDADGAALDHPAIYFTANLGTANQIAYIPGCNGSEATVYSLLDADNANVNWPNIDAHGHTNVKHVLDTLLCKLDASKIPYDAKLQEICWQDIFPDDSANHPETVQQAIDALVCHKQEGGCCSITISAGDDIAAKLSVIENGQDADICIHQGEYKVVQSILLQNKGHITLHGCGSSARVLAPNNESVFIFKKCKSVTVRDITLQSSKEGETGVHDNLKGALDIEDVDSVLVESTHLFCPIAHGERSASCLRISFSRHSNKRTSVRVLRNQLNPGHKQSGLLLVNVGRAQVEDNDIKVRQKSKNWVLQEKLKDARFRKDFRRILISNISFSRISTVSGVYRNASVSFERTTVYFSTDKSLVNAWSDYVKNNPPTKISNNQDLVKYLKQTADQVLLSQGQKNNVPLFAKWYLKMESSLPAIAGQGIVCAGRLADDIRIINNSMYGVAQGVHIGLSHNEDTGYLADIAGRVQVKGNHIVVFLSAETKGARHGIFVGNSQSLDIEANHIQLERFPRGLDRPVEGVRVYGLLGYMALIRNNHCIDFSPSIRVNATSQSDRNQVWQVTSNMMENGHLTIDPIDAFLIEHNY